MTISPRTMFAVSALAITTFVTGCQTAPSKESGVGTITTVTVTPSASGGPGWRATVISIKDDAGTEVYTIFKKGMFQVSADFPPGVYEITHTCSLSTYRYDEMPGQWQYAKWSTKLRLNAGDLIKYVAEGALTMSGVICQGKFFVPRGQLIQPNKVIS